MVTRSVFVLREAWRVVREGPKRADTPEERSRERYRRVALSAASSGVVRALFFLTTFITFPLLIRYLGTERFGLWATLTSVTALLTFTDLGISNGALNAVAEALGKEDRSAAQGYVSSSFFTLGTLALLFAGTFILIYPSIDWGGLFNVGSAAASQEAGPATAVFVGCLIASLPLGLSQKVYMALQETFVASLWMAVGIVIGLAGVVIGVALRVKMPWLVLASAGGPVLGSLLCSLHLFYYRCPWLRPSFRTVTRRATKVVMSSGGMFFVLAIAGAVAYQSDTIVIARILGASEVSQYAVPMKIFFLPPSLLSLVFIPLWPAYREAIVRGDMGWVHRTFRRSINLSLLVAVPFSIALLLWGSDIIRIWAGPSISTSLPLLMAFGSWTVLSSLGGPMSMLLNGANAIKFQVTVALIMATCNIVLSVWLVGMIGVAGAVLGSFLAQLVCVFVPSILFIRRLFLRAPTQNGANGLGQLWNDREVGAHSFSSTSNKVQENLP